MRPHLDSRTGIFDDSPELECLWDDGKDCPFEPAEGEWFCHGHLEAADADPAEYLRQMAAAERMLDDAGCL